MTLFNYKTTAIETHYDKVTDKPTNVTTYRADIPAIEIVQTMYSSATKVHQTCRKQKYICCFNKTRHMLSHFHRMVTHKLR